MFWMKSPLREEAAAAGDGGGGAGAGGADGGGAAAAGTALTLESITALLNTTINGAIAKVERRIEKIEKPVVTPPVVVQGGGQQQQTTTPATESEKLAQTKLDEALARLATVEEERKTEKTETQNRELAAEVKTALSEFTWDPTQGGKDIAFDYFKGRAKRTDDGRIMIGDVELNKYVKEQVPRIFKGMLAARQVGGAGADRSTGGQGGKKPVDLSDIKPGMTKETEAAAVSSILAALKEASLES